MIGAWVPLERDLAKVHRDGLALLSKFAEEDGVKIGKPRSFIGNRDGVPIMIFEAKTIARRT